MRDKSNDKGESKKRELLVPLVKNQAAALTDHNVGLQIILETPMKAKNIILKHAYKKAAS